jgi:hypothetical protein
MAFKELFSKSWNEYRLNFKQIFKLILVFVVIPSLIVFFIGQFLFFSNGQAEEYKNFFSSFSIENPPTEEQISDFNREINSQSLSTNWILLLLSIGAAFFSMFFQFGFTKASLKDKKINYSNSINYSKKLFFASLGFVIVTALLLLGLFILIIIPGIIFSVYWFAGYYVYLNEDKKIIESLRTSYRLVKGRWWKTFGYLLLFILIIILINIAISIPSAILGIIFFVYLMMGNFSIVFFIINQLFSAITGIVATSITLPLVILFFKNMYLEYKKRK